MIDGMCLWCGGSRSEVSLGALIVGSELSARRTRRTLQAQLLGYRSERAQRAESLADELRRQWSQDRVGPRSRQQDLSGALPSPCGGGDPGR